MLLSRINILKQKRDKLLIPIRKCKSNYMQEVWKYKRNQLSNMITLLEHERKDFNA